MEIKTTYVCNGAMYCGFKPENVEIIEERQVLYPAVGYELQDKAGNSYSAVWLKNGDTQDNYIEIPESEDDEQSING